jgi:hypothetical protein
MEFAVRHHMPGRIRLRISALCVKRTLTESMLAWLQKQDGIKSARVNYDCYSFVIVYDPAVEVLLRGLLDQLRHMSAADLQLLVGSAAKPAIAKGEQNPKDSFEADRPGVADALPCARLQR